MIQPDPSPIAVVVEVGGSGVVTGAGGTYEDCTTGTAVVAGVCGGGLLESQVAAPILDTMLLEAADGCPVAPLLAGAVPNDGVGAQVAERPLAKLCNPSAWRASGFPAGSVPT
jgi:hypothetical protein